MYVSVCSDLPEFQCVNVLHPSDVLLLLGSLWTVKCYKKMMCATAEKQWSLCWNTTGL